MCPADLAALLGSGRCRYLQIMTLRHELSCYRKQSNGFVSEYVVISYNILRNRNNTNLLTVAIYDQQTLITC